MPKLKPSLSYANVVSTLCLFLILGGGAWAMSKLPKNSVGPKQIKANAVDGSKVADGSLTGADIKVATLGEVPSASNATQLGGVAAGSYQRSIDSTCADGQAVTAINHGGTAGCSAFLRSSDPAGGSLQGTLGAPTLAPGAVQPASFSPNSSFCALHSDASATAATFKCTGGGSPVIQQVLTGSYCIKVPFTPTAVVASVDNASAGFPLAYTSTNPSSVATNCGIPMPSANALVVTYNHDSDVTGSVLASREFEAFIY